MPLPDESETPTVTTTTQLAPSIVKVGQLYSVPYAETLAKEKDKPGNKKQ